MIEIRAAGVGLEKKQTQPISLEEEKLWEQGLLEDSTPHGEKEKLECDEKDSSNKKSIICVSDCTVNIYS